MKKLYTIPEYKRWNKRRCERLLRVLKKRKHLSHNHSEGRPHPFSAIKAPNDFRLLNNVNECLAFFREVRSFRNCSIQINGIRHVKISLAKIQQIDYASISALIAIVDGLRFLRTNLQGDFPEDKHCRDMIIQSGFLNHMYDRNNKQYNVRSKSSLLFFEKGVDRLSRVDNERITMLIRDVVKHLTGVEANFAPLKTILLEICGNSIEHAYIENKHWLLGVKYEDRQVVFTVTDIGKGILDTLYRKFGSKLSDWVKFNSRLDILKGAFDRKYGSSTREINRNKGLPSVKCMMEEGVIQNLVVLTNDVIWFYNDNQMSKNFSVGDARFRGTLYQWVITNECIINNSNNNDKHIGS